MRFWGGGGLVAFPVLQNDQGRQHLCDLAHSHVRAFEEGELIESIQQYAMLSQSVVSSYSCQ